MKTLSSLSCLFALSFCGYATADITLNIPDDVDLLSINAQEPKAKSSFFDSQKVTLPNGENQIVFRYTAYFQQGQERIKVPGDAIIAKFSASDTTLNFVTPKYRDEVKARKLIKNMDWSLVDQKGTKVAVQQDSLLKDGFQLMRDYPREARDYNTEGGIAAIHSLTAPTATTVATNSATTAVTATAAAVTTTAAATTTAVTATTATAQPTTSAQTAEDLLYFWYNKADDAAKARFKAYINAQ